MDNYIETVILGEGRGRIHQTGRHRPQGSAQMTTPRHWTQTLAALTAGLCLVWPSRVGSA